MAGGARRRSTPWLACIIALICGLALPAFADKPEGVGRDRGGKQAGPPGKGQGQGEAGHSSGKDKHGPSGQAGEIGFRGADRDAVRVYFGDLGRDGNCPPGLAKKQNGCLPPGQAKKWALGQPLARDVVFYDLPRELTVRIGLPPPGHRYVRVAGDILMIAIGTGMVVDAIRDLGRL